MLWNLTEVSEYTFNPLDTDIRMSPALAQLLAQRSVLTKTQAINFLYPKLSKLKDPFEIHHLETAADRILRAIKDKSSIYIIGDYDVDGITSTTLLTAALRHFGLEPKPFVPRRMEEGYGLTLTAINRLLEEGTPDLLIVLDSGTNSVQEVAYLRSKQIDIIIVDHHRSKETIPEDCILVNPCVFDTEDSPLRNLCTVGLTFKLVHGLVKKLKLAHVAAAETIVLKRFLDLVALGTITDLMPLTEENRILVSYGLKEISNTERLGLQALLKVSGLDPSQKIVAADVSYKLGPRINASGRLADAALPINMLLSSDKRYCIAIAQQLEDYNRQRQDIERHIYAEAELAVEAFYKESAGIILYNPEWHSGVVGIIAGKLCRKYQRPVIVLGCEGDLAKGSGRSVPGVNLVAVFQACTHLLKGWGGHPMAVGVSLEMDHLTTFRALFNKSIQHITKGYTPQPTVELNCWITVDELQHQFLDQLELLHPFGEGNPEPILGIRAVVLTSAPIIFNERHFRFQVLNAKHEPFSGVAWGMAENPLPMRVPVDLAVKAYWNRWNGRKSPQIELIAWRYAETKT